MKVLSLRDGAVALIRNNAFVFNGAAGSEYLNTRRTTPIIPPSHVLDLKAGTVYKLYSGVAFEPSQRLPDVRPVAEYWRKYGVKVERVDYEKVTDAVSELVVYVTCVVDFNLKSREFMFESFDLGMDGDVEMFQGSRPNRVEGFVPNATRQIQDAGARRQGDITNMQQNATSDEEARKKMDEWLNTPDVKTQTSSPGAPAGTFQTKSGILPASLAAKVVEKGGVRALTPND